MNDYAVMVPFPDMLSGAARQAWLDVDEDAIWYVGEAWVNGHWTDHVAIRRPGADVQVWIEQGDPFPAKLAIVYTDEESLPSYTARFSKWATSLPADSVFEFTPPEGAERIDVVASSGAGR